MKLSKLNLLTLAFLSPVAPLLSCDLCGCYNPKLDPSHERPYSFYTGVAEQFTHFGTERLNGDKQSNPKDEFMDSSITQFVVGSTFLENRVGLQLSVPFIYRSYQKVDGFEVEKGHLSGIGDIALTANMIAWRKEALFHEEIGAVSDGGKSKSISISRRGEPDFTSSINLIAGVKLPTGDTGRLKGNYAEEEEIEGAPETGIGPHDLTLGTGSVDGIFGLQTEFRYKALFLQADVQYTLRSKGDYEYRFADDLTWSGGPGVYLHRSNGKSLALQCAVSGETKGYDKFQGSPDPDSGITALFVGPRVLASFGKVTAEIEFDLPAFINNTAFQTTADYRIRAGFSVRF